MSVNWDEEPQRPEWPDGPELIEESEVADSGFAKATGSRRGRTAGSGSI